MTLSSLMQLFKKVIYLDKVSNAFGMSPEAMSGDEEERLGKVSNFFLEKKLTWKHLRKLLIRHNEMQAVEFVYLMEEYVREGNAKFSLMFKDYSLCPYRCSSDCSLGSRSIEES